MEKTFKPEELVPVLIKEFISATKLPVDIYIRLSDMKYVLLYKAGDDLLVELMQKYQQKEIDTLYVVKTDYAVFVDQNLNIGGVLLTRKELEGRKKLGVLNRMSASVFKELQDIGLSKTFYNHACVLTKSTMDLIETKVGLSELFLALAHSGDELVAHSLAVSSISVLIAKQMGWSQLTTLEKLSLGGMLHDVGLKELPPELLKKSRAAMTHDEVELYESHPYRGLQSLMTLGLVPEDVLSIAHEHHEHGTGQGYPRHLKNVRTHPLAKVVSLADTFCEMTFQGVNNPQPKSPVDAVGFIKRTMGQPFSKEAFDALEKLVSSRDAVKKAA